MTEADIVAAFNKAPPPILETFGGGVIAYERALHDRITMEWLADRRHCHSVDSHPKGGIVQGGVIAGWLDSAMAHACVAKSAFSVAVPSLEIKVTFLSPVHPGLYRSYGWIVRWGRSIAFMESELRDADGAVVARASSTAALRHLKPA